jgi:hypothetical protein
VNSPPPPTAAIPIALLSLASSAINAVGFLASDLALTKLLRSLGFWAPLLLVGPMGVGLLVVGLAEAAAAVALFSGGIMLLFRRRAGIWVTMVACAPALLAGLLLVTGLVPAPLVLGKTMAGIPTQPLAWTILACAFVTAALTVALSISRPARAG